MSRFDDPDTLACPNCDSYFYRKVPKSITMHYHIQFSDGGVKSFMRDMLPALGRCQTCRFIIENIADLAAIDIANELPNNQKSNLHKVKTWIGELLTRPNRYDIRTMDWKYNYLAVPTFEEYAELFAVSVDVEAKRQRAVQASREFHQQFCLSPEDKEAIYRNEGYRGPTELEQSQYNEMADYLLTHPIEPVLDKYTLLCADLLRIQGEFSKALEQYGLVKNSKLNDVIELGRKCCEDQETCLIRISG